MASRASNAAAPHVNHGVKSFQRQGSSTNDDVNSHRNAQLGIDMPGSNTEAQVLLRSTHRGDWKGRSRRSRMRRRSLPHCAYTPYTRTLWECVPARTHWDTCSTRTLWDVLCTHSLGHVQYSTRAPSGTCSGTHPLGHV